MLAACPEPSPSCADATWTTGVAPPTCVARACLKSIAGPATPATHARRVGEAPTDDRSEEASPPCERTRQTPRAHPTLLFKYALGRATRGDHRSAREH